MSVSTALTSFVDACVSSYPVLEEVFDRDWRSPCEVGEPYSRADDPEGLQRVRWVPLKRHAESATADFAPLERALELTIHQDIKDYFAGYWSGGLEAQAPDGHVSLILLWNDADRERLLENLIGHAMAKQRSRSNYSVFFACTEVDSELFLSVDNSTGAVLLEKPGYKPIRQVAENLESFLNTLTPAQPSVHPERAILVND